MPDQISRILVHAELEIIWNVLEDYVEKPQKYAQDIEECRVVKTLEDEYLREIHMLGTCFKEKISIKKVTGEIHREIFDPLARAGKVIIKAVPTSVQNPVAPVDLQYFLELELEEKKILLSSLMKEQLRLKEASEELEKHKLRMQK